MVPPCSGRITRVPPYSRIFSSLPVRGYHPLWPDFPIRSGSHKKTTGLFRFRSPLLTESRLMSFPPGTEMFQFPGFASLAGSPLRWGFPIRTSADHRALAPPRSLSQRATSFIACACQGIHQMLFKSLDLIFSETRNQSSVAGDPWPVARNRSASAT